MKRLYKVFLEDPTSTSPISECTVVAGNAEHAVESAKLAFPGKALDSVSSMPHKNLIIAGEIAAENDYADMRRFQALYISASHDRDKFKDLLRESVPCIGSIGTIELLERITAALNKKSRLDYFDIEVEIRAAVEKAWLASMEDSTLADEITRQVMNCLVRKGETNAKNT